jgi:hypothetical protein
MTSQIGIRKSGLRIRIRKNLFPAKMDQIRKPWRVLARIGSGSSILGQCGPAFRISFCGSLFGSPRSSRPKSKASRYPACLILYRNRMLFTCGFLFGLDVGFNFSCVRWQEFVCDCRVGDQRQAEQASGCLLWRHGKLCPDTYVQFLISVLNPA